jgi:hypothetical protein
MSNNHEIESGARFYTRDQLLELKDQAIVLQPPAFSTLPANIAHALMKNNNVSLTNTLTQTMPPPGMVQRKASFDPINTVELEFMAIEQSSQDDVKLNEAEKPWKPSHLIQKADMTEEERVTFELLSKFRSMLNKLTAENFDLLVEQVKTYKIDTSERLDSVGSLVFEKAISEPKFVPTYAKLCKEVAFITSAQDAEQQRQQGSIASTLKKKLIAQCQKEFEQHYREGKKLPIFNQIEERLQEIENLPSSKERDEEKASLEEKHYRVRQRANGTVKFIGELFKIDMLTSKIMRACIEMLLAETTEEKIEQVCKLLTTIGGKMEHMKGRQVLDRYFQQLREMLHPNHKVIKSSRIKFEIQNLEDLSNVGWKARRPDMTPKTLDQIQMDVEHEQQMINYQTRQNARDDRQNRGGYNNNNNNNNNNRRNQGGQQDNEGWNVQQSKNSRPAPAISFNKISLPNMTSYYGNRRIETERNTSEMAKIVDSFLTQEKAIDMLNLLRINKDVMVEIYNKYFDRKDKDRENLMLLVCEMLKAKKLSAELNRDALYMTMDLAKDLQCDVPRVYEYIAHFLGKISYFF